MKTGLMRKFICVMLSLALLALPSQDIAAAVKKERVAVSLELNARLDSGDAVLSKKAVGGAAGVLVKDPEDKAAGEPLTIAALYAIWKALGPVIGAGSKVVSFLQKVSAVGEVYLSAKERHPGDTQEIIRATNVALALAGLELGLELGLEKVVDIVAGAVAKKGVPIVGDAAQVVELWDLTTGAWNLISDKDTLKNLGGFMEFAEAPGAAASIGAGIGVVNVVTNPAGALINHVVDGIKDKTAIGTHGNFVNPVADTPRTVSFSEGFSGVLSAIPDHLGSSNSSLSFSGTGARTGALETLLTQNMNGRFKAYIGWANTLVNVPVTGSVTGVGVLVHGRPISAMAKLSMQGIGDFDTAWGPFTINPNAASYGTFNGNTFDPFTRASTGDVVLYYNARPR